MRKILFRGMRVDNGEWVTAHSISYSEMKDGTMRVELGAGAAAELICDEHGNTLEESTKGDCISYVVHEESVGVFTGFEDSDGNKVFEDDLVLVGGKAMIVVWNTLTGAWEMRGSLGHRQKLCDRSSVRVIGNTFDLSLSLDPMKAWRAAKSKNAREIRANRREKE